MIPVEMLRASTIKTWQQCPLKFFVENNLGIRWPSGPKARLGTISHEVMRILAECNMTYYQRHPEDGGMDYEDGVTGFQTYVVSLGSIDVDELSKFVYDYYTKDIDPMSVPQSYQRKDSSKNVNAWLPYKEVQTSIANCFDMGPRNFDVRTMNVIAAEQAFSYTIEEDWAKFDYTFRGQRHAGYLTLKGSMDLVIQREDGTVEVIDYKFGKSEDFSTGKTREYSEFSDDIQLQMYHLAAKRVFGWDISQVTIVFANESKSYSIIFDDEQYTLNKIRNIYEQMQKTVRPAQVNTENCIRFCPYAKNTMEDITSLPLVRARSYEWGENDQEKETKIYRICGQCAAYTRNFSPLHIMECIARYDCDLSEYKNV